MYNVLIVDDESTICEGLSRIIDWNKCGFDIVGFACNGLEAIEKIKKSDINLVVADIRMPGMDGIELSRQIKEYDSKIRVMIISGYSDFNYARKAMEYDVKAYLLKPVIPDELLEQLMKIHSLLDEQLLFEKEEHKKNRILRDHLLYEFVNGYTSINQIGDELKKYHIDLSGDAFNIALLSIDDFANTQYQSIENAKSIKLKVRDAVEGLVRENKLGYVYEDIDGVFGIIIPYSKGTNYDENVIHRNLETITRQVESNCGAKTTAGYGMQRVAFDDVKTCRREAFRALERKIINKEERVFSYSAFAAEEKRLWDFKWSKDDLMKAVEEMDEALVKKQVSLLINDIASKGIARDVIKSIIVGIVLEISALIKNYGGDANRIFSYAALNQIDTVCDDINIINEWIISICGKCRQYIAELKAKKNRSLIDHVIEYVDAHYCEDISLSLIADKFYINSAYLGQLFFKESAGRSFSEYVNRKRINEAKRLCLKGELKIYEIIEKAGFKNSEYFYRQFKRYEGITFAEFRDRMEK